MAGGNAPPCAGLFAHVGAAVLVDQVAVVAGLPRTDEGVAAHLLAAVQLTSCASFLASPAWVHDSHQPARRDRVAGRIAPRGTRWPAARAPRSPPALTAARANVNCEPMHEMSVVFAGGGCRTFWALGAYTALADIATPIEFAGV